MICSKCHEDKDVSKFHKDPTTPRGLSAYCKSCVSAYGKAYRKHTRVSQPASRNYKRCSKCKATKPVEEFNRDHGRHDGLHFWCKECYATYQREARLADPERARKANHLYYLTPAGHKASLEASHVRRARKQQASGTFTPDEFEALCHAVGDRCMCCSKQVLLVPDHVIPLSKGGSNGIDNIQPLCQPCNGKKHTNSWDFRLGLEAT